MRWGPGLGGEGVCNWFYPVEREVLKNREGVGEIERDAALRLPTDKLGRGAAVAALSHPPCKQCRACRRGRPIGHRADAAARRADPPAGRSGRGAKKEGHSHLAVPL